MTFAGQQLLLQRLTEDVSGRLPGEPHGLDGDVDGQPPGGAAVTVQNQLQTHILAVQRLGHLQRHKFKEMETFRFCYSAF